MGDDADDWNSRSVANLFVPVSGSILRDDGTSFCELRIYNINDAHELVGERPNRQKNGRGGYTPLVIVPASSRPSCCCIPCCYLSIPAGFSAIVEQFGAHQKGDEDDGTWSPGFHCLGPGLCCASVERLISKQYIVFDTPVKECTSSDNMPVTLDVMVVFHIHDATTFFQRFNQPDTFQSFLQGQLDELIRSKALKIEMNAMYDLYGEDLKSLSDDLSMRFSNENAATGITLEKFCIKNVELRPDMVQMYMRDALIKSELGKSEMEQTYNKLGIVNQEETRKLKEQCKNEKEKTHADAEREKQAAQRKTQEVEAQTQAAISEKVSNRDNDAKQIKAEGELELAKIEAQIKQLTEELKTKTSAEVNRIHVEAEAFCKKKQLQAVESYAENIARGKLALGEAEGVASAAFAARRAHEAELKRLDILDSLVHKKMTIATSQENTAGLSADNAAVTQVSQQGLEALRAKLAEITATSVSKVAPRQVNMG